MPFGCGPLCGIEFGIIAMGIQIKQLPLHRDLRFLSRLGQVSSVAVVWGGRLRRRSAFIGTIPVGFGPRCFWRRIWVLSVSISAIFGVVLKVRSPCDDAPFVDRSERAEEFVFGIDVD